ncbi:hypothetical protein LTR08_005594 [Meristemomyces frigidus]|nr:hypothetical protein LTR08_005594 [Meristemomyces frigidus]
MSPLACLPEELISNIAARLDSDDMSSLRLTCQAIEKKVFFEFATEYFTGKCFMITTESLKVLVGIASSERLRGYLHDVYICTALFSEQAFNCPSGCHNCAWQPTVRQSEAYRTYMLDQKRLADSAEDKAMLLSALTQLGHLNSIRLVDGVDSLLSSGVGTAGLCKVTRRTGRQPLWAPEHGKDTEYTHWLSHVWKIIIQGLAGSGCAISGLDARITSYLNGLTLTRDLNMGKDIPELRKALTNLKRLRLTLRGNMLVKKDKTPDRVASAQRLKKFASCISAVEDLTLAYDSSAESGFVHYNLMKNLRLGGITTLALDTLDIDSKTLASTLAPMSSIKDLKLVSVNLLSGTWVAILTLLNKLKTLDHLHLLFLQEARRKAYFLTQPEDVPADYYGDENSEAPSDWADVDESEDSDNEMPDLEPADSFDTTDGPTAEETADDATTEESLNFVAPGHEHMGETGYYICIRGAQIAKYLPVFIAEYNVGPSLEDAMAMDPFAGPAGFNGIMNAILGPLPPLPPGAVPPAMPNNLNPPPGLAGAQGNAAANGLFTVGAGPGYQMMMGAMPMPMFPNNANQPPGAAPQAAPGPQATPGGGGQHLGNAGSAIPLSAGMDGAADGNAVGGAEERGEYDSGDGFEEDGGTTLADLD